MARPQDNIPLTEIGKSGIWQTRHINERCSDGDPSKWPSPPEYRPSSEEVYRVKLAEIWTRLEGLYDPAVKGYYLDKLPNGYAAFEKTQPGGSYVYKRLFGHPSGRFFDSVLKFSKHFQWLMSEMNGDCECVLCSPTAPRKFIPRKSHNKFEELIKESKYERRQVSSPESDSAMRAAAANLRPQRNIKPSGGLYAVDEEGTEDIYKHYIKKLEDHKESRKGIEDDIREKYSLDWRAEHELGELEDNTLGKDSLQQVLTRIENQHSFVPRVGELVLWIPNFLEDLYLLPEKATSQYKFYSFAQKCHHGFPTWRGGVVAAVPAAAKKDEVDFEDILHTPSKADSLNVSGFRIETFPDPNDPSSKVLSKQYKYVPLRNIRPLSHWSHLLYGIPRAEWHPSIEYALTCMTSMSLVEKWWFKGEWPNAKILCKGIFLGSELIVVGDSVRLTPKEGSGNMQRCTDILVIDSIQLHLAEVRPDHVSPQSPLLSSRCFVTLTGRAYTLDVHQSFEMRTNLHEGEYSQTLQSARPRGLSESEVKAAFRPVGTAEYGPWYHLHNPDTRFAVSHEQVLGRLYEAGAVRLWTGQVQHRMSSGEKGGENSKPNLNFDVESIQKARQLATQMDARLEEVPMDEVRWHWADTRAEGLDLATLNSMDVGRYHAIRDRHTLKQWHAIMRLLNGDKDHENTMKFVQLPQLGTRGRKPGSKVINGKVYMAHEIPTNTPTPMDQSDVDMEANSKPKYKSALAGAALVETDSGISGEEGGNGSDSEGGAFQGVAESVEVDDVVVRPKPRAGVRNTSLTKAQIMEKGQAVEDFVYSSDDDDDNEWLADPLPLVRGGTEESEGGDYRPG